MGLAGTPGDHLEPVTHDHVPVGSWMSPWLHQPSEQPVPVSRSTSSSAPVGLRGSDPCHLAAVGHLAWEHPPAAPATLWLWSTGRSLVSPQGIDTPKAPAAASVTPGL